MWISRGTYDELRERVIRLAADATAEARHNASLVSTLDWLMVRVTQLEKERAALQFKLTGVVIETPVISREPVSAIPQNVPVDALPIFEDMGAEQAKKLGVGWNEDGTVKYA